MFSFKTILRFRVSLRRLPRPLLGRSNARLFGPGDATPNADSFAALIHRRSSARMTGTKDISALIFDAVAGTAELLAILVVHHATSGLGTNNLSALIRCAG
jgi:hypothetical protein